LNFNKRSLKKLGKKEGEKKYTLSYSLNIFVIGKKEGKKEKISVLSFSTILYFWGVKFFTKIYLTKK
jgi:hypothetical protein